MSTPRYRLGVDLGTTATAVAINSREQTEIVELSPLDPTIPSVLWLDDQGEFLHGHAAQGRSVADPAGVAREFKRRFGDSVPVFLRGKPYSADDLTLRLLQYVVGVVEADRGTKASELVLCHPASWGQFKRSLLADAIANTDLPPATLISEPEAAAIHYATSNHVDEGAVVGIYDLGGGTFDIAFLRRIPGGWEILGEPGGLGNLGGVDFDASLFHFVLAAAGIDLDTLDLDDPDTASAGSQLRQDCVEAKKALSSNTATSVPLFIPGHVGSVRVTRAEFEELIRPDLLRSITAFEEAATEADLNLTSLDRILLVGGSSRIPAVSQMVGRQTGLDVFVDIHPKFGVAMGAVCSLQREGDATSSEDRKVPDRSEPTSLQSKVDAQADEQQASGSRHSRRIQRPHDLGDPPPKPSTSSGSLSNRSRLSLRLAMAAGALAVLVGALVWARLAGAPPETAALVPQGQTSEDTSVEDSTFEDIPVEEFFKAPPSDSTSGSRGVGADTQFYATVGPKDEPAKAWTSLERTQSPPIVDGSTAYVTKASSIDAIGVVTGQLVWTYPFDGVNAVIAKMGESLLVFRESGDESWVDVLSLDGLHVGTVELHVENLDENFFTSSIHPIQGGFILVATMPGLTTVLRVDASSGKAIWRSADYPNQSLLPVVIVGQSVLLPLDDGQVIAMSVEDGQGLWAAKATQYGATISASGGVVVISDSNGGTLAGFDALSGDELWTAPYKLGSTVALSQELVFGVGRFGSAFAIDIQTGKPVWTEPLTFATSSSNTWVAADHATFYMLAGSLELDATSYDLVAFDSGTGETLWHATSEEDANANLTWRGPLSAANGILLIEDVDGYLSAWG